MARWGIDTVIREDDARVEAEPRGDDTLRTGNGVEGDGPASRPRNQEPLTPMKLAIQHLRQTYLDRVPDFGQVIEEVTRTVIGQIDALSRIASEFSHFARLPKRRLERCDVNAIAKESVGLFGQDTSVRFALHLDPRELVSWQTGRSSEGVHQYHQERHPGDGGWGTIEIGTTLESARIVIRIRDHGPEFR